MRRFGEASVSVVLVWLNDAMRRGLDGWVGEGKDGVAELGPGGVGAEVDAGVLRGPVLREKL